MCPHIHVCLSIPTFPSHTDLGTQEVFPADWLSHRAKSKERRAESSALRIPNIESAGRAEAEEPGKNQDLQEETQQYWALGRRGQPRGCPVVQRNPGKAENSH